MMIAVAVMSVVLCFWGAKQRWSLYRSFAEYHSRIENMYHDAKSGDDIFYKQDLTIEQRDPERPPLSPYDPRSFQREGMRLQTEYHAKMSRYWNSRW